MIRDQENHIDESIRRGLESWEPAYRPGSWERLRERLDLGEGEASAMDDQIRTVLSGTPVGQPAGWEKLAARLDAEETDAIVSRELKRVSVPTYRPSSWAKLAARLELIAQRRSCIAAYKITEFSLLLSALLLFWNYYPGEGISVPLPENGSFPIATLEGVTADPARIPGDEEAATTLGPASSVREESTTETVAPPDVPTIAFLDFTPVRSANEQNGGNNAYPLSLLTDLNRKVGGQSGTVDLTKFTDTESLVDEIPESVHFAAGYPPAPQPALILPVKEKERGTAYLRAYLSPWDFNQVVTPASVIGAKEVGRDSRISYGTSAGVSLDFEHGKNGHSYGLNYSRRSYIPTAIVEVEANGNRPNSGPLAPRDTSISRITFHTISIPFSYQRTLLNNGRWRLRAGVGVEASMVMSAKFYKSPNFDENIANYFTSVRRARTPGSNILSARDLTHPEKGLLQGGSPLQNSSFSVSFSFAIERRLNDHLGIYVAPRLTRALYYTPDSGLGPFSDRIHQNAIQLGARWRLDK